MASIVFFYYVGANVSGSVRIAFVSPLHSAQIEYVDAIWLRIGRDEVDIGVPRRRCTSNEGHLPGTDNVAAMAITSEISRRCLLAPSKGRKRMNMHLAIVQSRCRRGAQSVSELPPSVSEDLLRLARVSL
jgi:hypothetical protein